LIFNTTSNGATNIQFIEGQDKHGNNKIDVMIDGKHFTSYLYSDTSTGQQAAPLSVLIKKEIGYIHRTTEKEKANALIYRASNKLTRLLMKRHNFAYIYRFF
jgi:hypothetical protein